MTEYIVNYNVKEFPNIIDIILKTFRDHDDFRDCGIQGIYVPTKSFIIFNSKVEPTLFGYPVYLDMNLNMGQFIIRMELFPKKDKETKEQPQNNTDVVYIVRVKPEFQINFKDTTVNHKFAGKILAQIRDAYVFELNGSSKAMVIIPFDWIECMAPSKIHWETRSKYNAQ